MKIIDKTPLVNEKGELGPIPRIQGMLRFGLRWPAELQTEKVIVTFFERQLEKGYTLIRNLPLGASGITVPLILLGPSGIYVIHITHLRGRFEASGEGWNEEAGNGFRPAAVNLIQQTLRLAAAVEAFLERQGVHVPVPIEPILLAANPGLHVQSAKPAVRVLRIDGLKSFVSGLAAAPRILSAEAVHEFAERLVNFRPVRRAAPPVPRPAPRSPAAGASAPPPEPQVSRARAIFSAAEESRPFNPADFDFAMVDEETALETLLPLQEAGSPGAASLRSSRGRRALGMTPRQWMAIAVLVLVLVLIVAVFAYLLLTSASLLP